MAMRPDSRRVIAVMGRAATVSAFCLAVWPADSQARQVLPVFLADNHAETFGWIVRTFDVDQPHVMVLVDAHSDATAAERSEEMREGLRRVASERERIANVEKWRTQGRLQAFNWIEPLMPRPVDQVCWLAKLEMEPLERDRLQREAVESLDGRLEVEPRSAGPFGNRWQTVDMDRFGRWSPQRQRVILAVDLDFFAGMGSERRERVFRSIWSRAMSWPGLAGVAFSVSRPWLKDDEEADALVAMACDAVARTRGAVMEIDVSLDDRPDHSLRAREAGGGVARWEASRASAVLRARWRLMEGNVRFVDRNTDFRGIMDGWGAMTGEIRPDAGQVDCDGVWRFRMEDAPVLRVAPPGQATGKVRWYVLEPLMEAVDLLPETGLGKGFAGNSGRWVHEARRFLTETTDFSLTPDRYCPRGMGRVRVAAEVECADGWLPVAPIELRFAAGSGFRGALSECFGMPYVFGVGEVREGDLSGVETGWGSDCANLLIHAWRRNGVYLAWGDPGRLRRQLAVKAERVRVDDGVAITEAEVECGMAIDFGHHVAAVWEDREPMGKLDGNDLVVHHLGGFPEIVSLVELARDRPGFALRVPRESRAVCNVKIAGDVVLAAEDRDVVKGFEKGDADVFVVNLEGVPSLREPTSAPRFDFRFPKERLAWLRERGVDAVSLANNHAGDAGAVGLMEAIQSLREAGIAVFGVGEDAAAACQPWRSERNGVRLAVFGVCFVEALTASENRPGVARLPEHAEILGRELHKARSMGEQVIVVVHGGDEYRGQINEDQRRGARWLVARGARVIAGAHPHVVQRMERHGGAAIVHSLGNAVYPKAVGKVDSGEVRVFCLGVE